MQINLLQVGSFEVNCVILTKAERAWIVDPGAEPGRIAAFLEARHLKPAAILLTHAHFDHIGGVPELRRRYPDISIGISAADAAIVSHPFNQYPPDYPPVKIPGTVPPEELVKELGGEVLSTPGHTPGGVSYYFAAEKLLLSGDTLFKRAFGRTDLAGGDETVLINSLKTLGKLPQETRVLPGHGPETTIKDEAWVCAPAR